MKKTTIRRSALLLCALLVLTPQPSFAARNEDASSVNMEKKIQAYEEVHVPYTYDESAPSVIKSDRQSRFVKKNGIYTNPDAKVTNRATLMITGDLMCQWRQQKAAYNTSSRPSYHTVEQKYTLPENPAYSGKAWPKFTNRAGDPENIGVLPQPEGFFDFNGSFRYVRNLLKQGDLVIGNLETMISQSSPLTMQCHQTEGAPYLNTPHEFLDGIDYAGFDLLTLANNHNCDTGVRGLLETLDTLDQYEFLRTGMFAGEEEDRYLIVDVNGIKIGMVSYSSFYNNKSGNFTKEGQRILLNSYSSKKITRDIAAAREAGAEFIIAFIHWGRENIHETTDLQHTRAQEIADAGADYIVGSHPHAIQPTDSVTSADGRTVPVIYSMGNFLSSMQQDVNNDSLVLQLDLKKSKSGKVTIASHLLHPCTILEDLELLDNRWETHIDSYVVAPHHPAYGVDKLLLRMLESCRADYRYMESSLARFQLVFGSSTSLPLDPEVTGKAYSSPKE